MADTTNTTEPTIMLTQEQIEKIKEAAQRRAAAESKAAEAQTDEASADDLGGPAEEAEAAEAEPVKPPRNVVLADKMIIEIYKGDEVVNTLRPYRNLLEACIVLRTLDPETIVSVYALEDAERSDPLPEGQEPPKYPLFDIIKKPVKEAGMTLVGQMVPDGAVVMEFQKLCEYMSFRSTLKGVNVTFLFNGGNAGGFSYLASNADVSDLELFAMYKSTRDQNAQYKAKVKEVRPTVRFDDDSNIITHL